MTLEEGVYTIIEELVYAVFQFIASKREVELDILPVILAELLA